MRSPAPAAAATRSSAIRARGRARRAQRAGEPGGGARATMACRDRGPCEVDEAGTRAAARRAAPRRGGWTRAAAVAARARLRTGGARSWQASGSASTSAARSPTSCCIDDDGRRAHQEGVLERRRLCARDRSRAWPELFAEHGLDAGADRWRCAMARRRRERDSGAQGRAHRPDHDQGLSRRPRDPQSPDAAALRPRLDRSRRRWSSVTLRVVVDERVDRRGRGHPAARSGRGASARSASCSARACRRSRSACSTAFANPAHERLIKAAIERLAPGLPLCDQLRGAARDQGVRAHLEHGDQRLRDAGGRAAICARLAGGPRAPGASARRC